MEHKPTPKYNVRVWYDERDAGQTFGAFDSYNDAAKCLVVLAGRVDVRSAKIEKVEV